MKWEFEDYIRESEPLWQGKLNLRLEFNPKRDVPFSMIYFSLYGFLKQKCDDENGYAPTWKV